MRNIVVTIVTVFVFGTALFVIENNRQGIESSRAVIDRRIADLPRAKVVRAAGRIEGQTEEVELRARIVEQIAKIHVQEGQWVSGGDTLVSLQSDRLSGERDLANALLSMEEAKKARLVNGFRKSEIDAARKEYDATVARVLGAEKAYARTLKLYRSNAVSQQTVDDRHTEVATLQAMASAARSRLETMELPAREDEILAADAAIRAAKSRLAIAEIDLSRAQVRAPSDGRILSVEAEVGELTGPESALPLIIMTDTRQLRAVAEIDEYDALRVSVGDACQISSDASDGVLANGVVIEIEPRMYRKKLFGQWAGERNDTYARRVWISIQEQVDLPVGLPVDVYIEARSNP